MPTPSNVHVDQLLTNMAVKYVNRKMIAPLVCPIIPVNKSSGLYWIFGKERFEAVDTLRAPKTEAKLIDWAMSQGDYKTHPHALADLLSDEELEDADQLDLESESVELLGELLSVGMEMRVAALLMNTNTWENDGCAAAWDTDEGDPFADLDAVVEALPYVDPNTVILSKPAWNAFKRNPNVLAALSGNERKTVTLQTAAELSGIPNWRIGEAYYNTAKRGKTPVLSRIWPDTPWIGYIDPTVSRRTLTAVKAFRKKSMAVQKERQTKAHAWWIEQSYEQGEEVVCDEAGYILTGAVTA